MKNDADFKGQRHHAWIADLQQQWTLWHEKLAVMERDKILETHSDERFRLEHSIEDIKAELRQIEEQLRILESAEAADKEPQQVDTLRPEKKSASEASREVVEHEPHPPSEEPSQRKKHLHGLLSKIPHIPRTFRYHVQAAAFVGILVFMSLLMWVRLFDLFWLDSSVEHLIMGMGNLLQATTFEASGLTWIHDLFPGVPFHDEIVMVSITEKSEEILGKFGRNWREKHAVLIDRLTEAEVKIIAFDIVFEEESQYDEDLIRAVQTTEVPVIMAVQDLHENEPLIMKRLKPYVDVGVAGMAGKLNVIRTASLSIVKHPGEPGQEAYLPCLALSMFLKYKGIASEKYMVALDSREIRLSATQKLEFSTVRSMRKNSSTCPILQEGDEVADLIIKFSPIETLRAQRYAYEEVYNGKINGELLKDKIVLIGREKLDTFYVWWGIAPQERSGVEIHADTLNTLLNGITIRAAGVGIQLAVMLALGGMAPGIRYRIPAKLWRVVLLTSVLLVYLVGTLLLYVHASLLLYPVYHIGMVWLSYKTSGKIKSHYFD